MTSKGIITSLSEYKVIQENCIEKYLIRGWIIHSYNFNLKKMLIQRTIELPESVIKLLTYIKRFLDNDLCFQSFRYSIKSLYMEDCLFIDRFTELSLDYRINFSTIRETILSFQNEKQCIIYLESSNIKKYLYDN